MVPNYAKHLRHFAGFDILILGSEINTFFLWLILEMFAETDDLNLFVPNITFLYSHWEQVGQQ